MAIVSTLVIVSPLGFSALFARRGDSIADHPASAPHDAVSPDRKQSRRVIPEFCMIQFVHKEAMSWARKPDVDRYTLRRYVFRPTPPKKEVAVPATFCDSDDWNRFSPENYRSNHRR
jgi:hypothetical protein